MQHTTLGTTELRKNFVALISMTEPISNNLLLKCKNTVASQ